MGANNSMTDATAAIPVEESPLRISLANAGPTGEISLIRVDGVVDTMTAGELDRVIASLVGRGRYRLVLDLAGVEYISSAGWGIFVSHLRGIRDHAGDIKLARMTPDVREIYELLEFDGLLSAYDQLDAAEHDFYQDGAALPDAAPPPGQTVAPSSAPVLSKTERVPLSSTASPETTLERTIQRLITEDPFYTIAEIRDELNRHESGQQVGWWTVFFCLRRHHLLLRRSRFRFFRRARKSS